jgi:hypothetical protein
MGTAIGCLAPSPGGPATENRFRILESSRRVTPSAGTRRTSATGEHRRGAFREVGEFGVRTAPNHRVVADDLTEERSKGSTVVLASFLAELGRPVGTIRPYRPSVPDDDAGPINPNVIGQSLS